MRLLLLIACTMLCSISNLRAAEYTDNFRIEEYLVKAVELQKLEPEQRANRLKEMAIDPEQHVPVIPLCRMLFDAKPDSEFRPPRMGAPHKIKFEINDGFESLEPIVLYEGTPILITWGYTLSGRAELASDYVEYCLKECRWRETKFIKLEKDQIEKNVEKFIELQKCSQEDKERLRQQFK